MGNAAASRGTRRADSVGSAGTSGAASASGAQPGGVAAAARGLSRRVSKRARNTMRGARDASSSAESVTSASTDEPKVKDVGYISLIRSGYNELVNAVIRPPRAKYDLDMLGPNEFTAGGVLHTREDLELINKRGQKLVCSHWRPLHRANPQPCMIYLHGNASCRIEALECLPLLLASGLSLFAFDFAGSGLSEGEYISLGWHERFDVEVVVGHLRESGKVSTIGLWGRSMGAATALMFGQQDPTIACMILDSPFSSLKKLIKELCETAQIAAPKFAFGLILRMIRSSVKSRAGFDMHKLSPIDFASTSYIPALFGAAEGDNFIAPHHSQDIHDQYAGDKNIVLFEGDHGSARPKFFMTSVGIWLHNTMLNHEVANATDTQEDLLERFHTEFSFPNPLTASMEGRNARRSSSTTISAWDTEEYYPVGGDAVSEEDYYEQAMLRKVIQLSLAEAAPSAGQLKNQEEGDLPTGPHKSSSKGTFSGDPSPSLRSSSSSCLVDDKVGDNVSPVPLDVELQVDDDHALVVGDILNTSNLKAGEELDQVEFSQGKTLAPAQAPGENLVPCSYPPSPESGQSLQPVSSSASQDTAAQLDSQSECSLPSPPQAPSPALPHVESTISEVDQDDLNLELGKIEAVQETPFPKARVPGVPKNVTRVGL